VDEHASRVRSDSQNRLGKVWIANGHGVCTDFTRFGNSELQRDCISFIENGKSDASSLLLQLLQDIAAKWISRVAALSEVLAGEDKILWYAKPLPIEVAEVAAPIWIAEAAGSGIKVRCSHIINLDPQTVLVLVAGAVAGWPIAGQAKFFVQHDCLREIVLTCI
jgi:hypothetical protein